MFDVVLHTGLEHPSLAWILVPTILAFFGGLLIGKYRAYREESRDTAPSN